MSYARSVFLAAGIALGLGVAAPGPLRAEDAPPAPAPAPAPTPALDTERAALLKRAEELSQQVVALYGQGKYAEATPLARESLEIREKALGKDHPEVATSLNNLAGLFRAQGSYAKARPLCDRALAIREKVLGKDHPDVATSLNNLGGLLQAQGSYADARPLFERALAIREKALGKDHPDVATILNNLAMLLQDQGSYTEARPLYERALAIKEKALGRDHPDVATSLNNLAWLLKAQGSYAESRPLFERALAIYEKARGKDHSDVATSLNNLALLLEALGSYAEARHLHERALAIREKKRGRDHPEVATSLNNLAMLLNAQGSYAEARPLCERALAIREQALGKDHPNVATSLANLAVLLKAQGSYAEARSLCERALAIREKALGKDHPDVAKSLNTLAGLLKAQGSHTEAMPLYQRALAIDVKALGKDHPDVATSLTNLAVLLQAQGSYAEARPLYERALAIRESALGRDHPDIASSLGNLAVLLRAQGSYTEARPLYERALAVGERALGKDHPSVATTLNNLAGLLMDQGAYAEAKPLYERALAIREDALGEDHSIFAQSLNNLALLLQAQGSYAEARPLYERALAIREKVLGREHPDVATVVNNLAGLFRAQGSFAEATMLFERALAINEKALGKDHPDVAMSLNNLAVLLEAQGSYAEGRPLYERVLSIMESHARTQLSALTASQRIALVRSTRRQLDNWLDFTPRVGLTGYPESLRLRGLVARAEAAERAMARTATGDDRRLLDALQAAQRRTSRLANDIPATADPDVRAAWQQRYAEAAGERERLTRDLAARVAPARTALERLDLGLADVQKAIPADTALVDVLRVRDRYLAWILRSTGDPVRLDIGAADAIEAACTDFVSAIAAGAGDVASADAIRTAGEALKARVWAPLAAKLHPTVARVVICPDAALASVPFAALPGKDAGRTLLEDLSISYVFHPFDLVPRKDAPTLGTGAVVVGGVDYEQADAGSKETPLPEKPQVLASLDRAPEGGAFGPLKATRLEAEALRDRLGKDTTTLLLGSGATEARFREAVKGRRIIHVATHGFAHTDLLAGLDDSKLKDALLSADAVRQLAVGHDPMLLSGLAFAGANAREGAAGDDGILTALEASYLNLDGADLVTLSACNTARGTAASGEGVLGLVSAFQMAGARRVLASLWKVDDEATRFLMERFYESWNPKEGPGLSASDALRNAQQDVRSHELVVEDPSSAATGQVRRLTVRPWAHPKYWAAFVPYGG